MSNMLKYRMKIRMRVRKCLMRWIEKLYKMQIELSKAFKSLKVMQLNQRNKAGLLNGLKRFLSFQTIKIINLTN
jgi:hypothetical protein